MGAVKMLVVAARLVTFWELAVLVACASGAGGLTSTKPEEDDGVSGRARLDGRVGRRATCSLAARIADACTVKMISVRAGLVPVTIERGGCLRCVLRGGAEVLQRAVEKEWHALQPK